MCPYYATFIAASQELTSIRIESRSSCISHTQMSGLSLGSALHLPNLPHPRHLRLRSKTIIATTNTTCTTATAEAKPGKRLAVDFYVLVPWSNRKIFRFLTVVNGSTVCVRARARARVWDGAHAYVYDQALARTRKRGMDRRQGQGEREGRRF